MDIRLICDANELQDALILELPYQDDKKIDYSKIDKKFFLGCHTIISTVSKIQKTISKFNSK